MAKILGGDGAFEDGSDAGPVGLSRISDRLLNGPRPEAGVSGRVFVVVGCFAVLVIWGLLYLGFARWKARYEELAAFGRTHVAPAVDPLEKIVPAGVEIEDWRRAVRDTRTMLVALTSAAVLDEPTMTALGDDVAARVAGATPENALVVMTNLWNDLEDRAAPVISSVGTPVNPNSRHAKRIERPARPKILPPKPKKEKETGSRPLKS